MPEELGKIERPAAEQFARARKLYLVPLVYSSKDTPAEYYERASRYWQQVKEQLSSLEVKIGKVNHVYHEMISLGGEEGMKVIERLNQESHQISQDKCENGAVFEVIENDELLSESIDWGKCLLIGLTSMKVASRISEFHVEALKKRNEFIVKRIDETLQADEAGLLFVSEGHSLQFPNDVEVFSVFPPALDEIHRWMRDQAAKEQGAEPKKEEETEGSQ
jgi:hypothetical protein